jgi:hypothetical protein
VTGDLRDLENSPLLLAEEATSHDNLDGSKNEDEYNSQTWTFYKLRTLKGSVSVDFRECERRRWRLP